MKYKGRLLTLSTVLSVHTLYIVYYFFRDGAVDLFDLLGYPLFGVLAYWAGLQYDRAVYYSDKDVLTNLYNRRFLIKAFDKAKSLASRMNGSLFLLVIDCDNFKEINDRDGHAKGDRVLTAIGDVLVASTRGSDLVARWGGDEFVVVGHHKDDTGLQAILGRLESQLTEVSAQMGVRIQVSIGSALYPRDGGDLYDLMKIADANMYASKRARKD
ncbi:GGDEF domain-containing protein [Paenibacillus xanthanilyticus]|uniref:GGDEF domain-containing protein n=1 Tax=Paenibacillus xanthanilyticus TaxID=1783531 RepID=A0ABV8K7Z8_9BACL